MCESDSVPFCGGTCTAKERRKRREEKRGSREDELS
jgi:hypothetical protein